MSSEDRRLLEAAERTKNWQRWGPYLSERQWGTVREDYSPGGDAWNYLPHEHARMRAYRWGEDGLLGITDRECRLCFALALWNGKDPILKERLYGLSGPEGNHGEDVKECYYYLDSSPTHAYLKALYKYPQAEFPYEQILKENRRRTRRDSEYDLEDTGVFRDNRYFDVFAEYAKVSPDQILIRVTVHNRGPEAAVLHLLPTFWYRNTWTWGCTDEGCWPKSRIGIDPDAAAGGGLITRHVSLGNYKIAAGLDPAGKPPVWLFTENETNAQRIFGSPNETSYVKDAFHDYVIHGKKDAVNPKQIGSKVAAHYILNIPAGASSEIRLRLNPADERPIPLDSPAFDMEFLDRIAETDAFYSTRIPATLSNDERAVARQAFAGLLWSKQFYHYIVKDWLNGDPAEPTPPPARKLGRNNDWQHVFMRDVLSMPDKWEYPWFAAWDLAFHMLPFAHIDSQFSKEQMILLLREWYMHPNGQLPAYEWALDDVNPPVHAWACLHVYKLSAPRGSRDRVFLEKVFHKLLLNFTWWVNRKDPRGKNLFGGGFLGLDNIGIFDRSRPLPTGGHLEQADGTAWMAFYCVTMLEIALELASVDTSYEDVASKFFMHFVAIADAINCLDGSGLWDETDGFYYDHLQTATKSTPLKIRSMVGLIPLFAIVALDEDVLNRLPGFRRRLDWFLQNRPELAAHIDYREMADERGKKSGKRLLCIPSRDRLVRMLRRLLDPQEFLSDYGIRSLSRAHAEQPFIFKAGQDELKVEYVPGESLTGMFGGNSNWRGPIWFPVNYLLIESLNRYFYYYGDSLRVECPTGSGVMKNLKEVAQEIEDRLIRLFLADEQGRRPCHAGDPKYATDPHWKDLVLFHEYFHGDTGRGLGASHQTGWTALAANMLIDLGRNCRG